MSRQSYARAGASIAVAISASLASAQTPPTQITLLAADGNLGNMGGMRGGHFSGDFRGRR